MKYWLFQIMYDKYPKSWYKMVERSIAAQHYPHGWIGEPRNIEELKKLRKGHKVIAAFKGHRFGGYGTLGSDLSRGHKGILVVSKKGEKFKFAESFDCEWTALNDTSRVFIRCSDLKQKNYRVDLMRGLCVSSTNERTFREIKARIDTQIKWESQRQDLNSLLGEEGKKKGRYVNYYERKPSLRNAAIELHGETCIVCGFNFGEWYGERGKGYIEVHHIKPLGARRKPSYTMIKNDLKVVCSNCHRMLHRNMDDVWSPSKLKRHIERLAQKNKRGRIRF